LSGCSLWWGYEISQANPDPNGPPDAPRASGTLLNPQLRIGISPDYMPLAFKEAPFGLRGVEVDFANLLGQGLNKQIVFVETPFADLIQALRDRRIDIIMSGMSVTAERAQVVSFTDSYATIGQMVLVRSTDQGAFPDIQSFARVTSKIGFVRTSTGEMAAKAFFPRAVMTPQTNVEEGVAALRRGELTVFIHDAPTVWRIANTSNEKDLVGLYWPLTKEPLAWAVRKDDEPLRFALNRELERWRLDGRLKEILSRWVALRIW